MYYLPYSEKNDRDSLEEFTKLLGYKYDSKIHITKELGSGTLEVITLDKGLYIRIWDCTFAKNIHLHRQPDNGNGTRSFTLVYYLTTEGFILHNTVDPGVRINKLWNTVFLSNNAEFTLEILPHIPVKCFSICFTREWMQGYDIDNSKLKSFITNNLDTEDPVFFFESYNATEEKMIMDVYDRRDTLHPLSLFLKSRVLTTINEFLTKASERQSLLAPIHADIYETNLLQVKAKLMSCLDSTLPGLKELAREFALSESTLKRSFKRKYGKSINEYYRDKKMAYAKELIQKKNKTVTETAYILGYEKVSHFIYMFKKNIGCLPGALRPKCCGRNDK